MKDVKDKFYQRWLDSIARTVYKDLEISISHELDFADIPSVAGEDFNDTLNRIKKEIKIEIIRKIKGE